MPDKFPTVEGGRSFARYAAHYLAFAFEANLGVLGRTGEGDHVLQDIAGLKGGGGAKQHPGRAHILCLAVFEQFAGAIAKQHERTREIKATGLTLFVHAP
jgi:hypothetical protein